jgi:hypothetical protein
MEQPRNKLYSSMPNFGSMLDTTFYYKSLGLIFVN